MTNTVSLNSAIHRGALDRFDQHRRSWASNAALRTLYGYWYAEVRAALQPVLPGNVIELGSGPGFAKVFIPELRTSDMVKAEWHDFEIDATRRWPFDNGALDGVVLFDVLHHLHEPLALFREASRALRPGGRLVLMEPYISLCSYPILRFFHPEDVDGSVDPFAAETSASADAKDPFAGNQALPGLMFGRHKRRFEQEFPGLCIVEQRLYSGLSYVASGGFGRGSLLPFRLWSGLFWIDARMPKFLLPLVAFRFQVVLERRGAFSRTAQTSA